MILFEDETPAPTPEVEADQCEKVAEAEVEPTADEITT